MSFDIFITILLGALTVVLTALGVLLAALGVGIAIAAIYGYAGIKEELRTMAIKHMSEAMTAKLKEYPSGDSIVTLIKRLESTADFYEQMQIEMVAPPESNVIERPSNPNVQVGNTSQVPSAPTGVTVTIDTYPGEEERDVPINRTDAAPTPGKSGDSGTDPR